MRLRELVEDPDLGLTMLTGQEALDREFTAVFTTDLRDPSRYLNADTVVLTGLMWWRGPADSEAFVRAAAERGVAAIAAGEAAWGSVPDDLVRACREFGVPLLAVPEDVSFGRIAEIVASRHGDERGRLLAVTLGRHRRLLTAVAEGRSLEDLLEIVFGETGVACWVATPAGRRIAGPDRRLPAADLDRIARVMLTADRLPARVDLGGGAVVSVLAVEPGLDVRVGSWFLIADGGYDEWSSDVQVTMEELASVIAVERRQWHERRLVDLARAGELIALVAGGRATPAELEAGLADFGGDPSGEFVVAVAECPGPDRLADAALTDAARCVDPHAVTGVFGGQAVALVQCRAGCEETLRAALERLAPGLGARRLAVGLSRPVPVTALVGAWGEGRYGVRLATSGTNPVDIVAGDDVTSHVGLLAVVPDDVRRAFAARVLGPILDYDERHGGDLLPTVAAFLQVDGSWSRCADVLQVHVNTVRYRIQRVEELTGRDLSRLEDRVDVLLALRSTGRT